MEKSFTDTTIKHHRKMARFKQTEFAEILGITSTDMSFMENKKTFPDLKTAYRMAELLKVTVGYLYSEEELEYMRYRENEKINQIKQ